MACICFLSSAAFSFEIEATPVLNPGFFSGPARCARSTIARWSMRERYRTSAKRRMTYRKARRSATHCGAQHDGMATRIALSGRGRRELRIERRDRAVFRSGGRPVYRKAGRLTPPSSVEVGVVGRSHHRFYWSNRVLMQRLAPLNATVGPPYVVALCIALAAAAGTTISKRLVEISRLC